MIDTQNEWSLEQAVGYTFTQKSLLQEALTHKSYSNEQGAQRPADNERLEFLGDAVLQLVVTSYLFQNHPTAPEGDMTRARADVVSEASLARAARCLSLGQVLRLGRGEDKSGGRDKDSLLSNALEALFGALYLDGGLTVVEPVILKLLTPEIDPGTLGQGASDYKTRLQELSQARYGSLPLYVQSGMEGPDHNRTFTVTVRLDGEVKGEGQGGSKKLAEQQAAREALRALGEL